MIDWNASAELNKCTIGELKARFLRFPKSTKKVVAVCDQCGNERLIEYRGYRDLCVRCITPTTRAKMSVARGKRKTTVLTRQRMSKTRRGLKPTVESRQKRSATRQNIPYDEWEAFACEKKYCPKFTEACRESNREKYGRECFICGKSEKANEQKLSVHHVDMDKAQGCESNWKLVPLCKHCHATAHNDGIVARLGYMVKDS